MRALAGDSTMTSLLPPFAPAFRPPVDSSVPAATASTFYFRQAWRLAQARASTALFRADHLPRDVLIQRRRCLMTRYLPTNVPVPFKDTNQHPAPACSQGRRGTDSDKVIEPSRPTRTMS